MALSIEPLTGGAIEAILPELARLRIAVFRDWPYLYDGNYDYERDYFAGFSKAPGSVVIAAHDGDQLVGAATATVMGGHADGFEKPFVEAGYDTSTIFYFGESILLPRYRGQGAGHRFFDERERHARTFPGIRQASFCAVVRSPDHPKKPADYVPLEAFWTRRGYQPVPGLVGTFEWRDIGDDKATAKPMQYWITDL
ncbi:MAG: GNAT family N-acetyltransferase [Hyphomicrobiaceae bacterium]